MDRQVAMDLAAAQYNGKSMAEFMTTANDIFKNNNGGALRPFSEPDVIFARFTDFLMEKCTKRERSLVFISEQLLRTWTKFHVGATVLGEHISESELDSAVQLVKALEIFNLSILLTADLRPDLHKLIEDAVAKTNKRVKKKLVYFRWMGAYWSVSEDGWRHLNDCVQNDQGFDMTQIGAKELRSRPRGTILKFRDVDIRTSE